MGVWTGGGPRPDSYTPLVAQGRAASGQTSWWNTIRENYRVSYKTFTIFWWCCWLKSTFPVVRFTTKLFFFFVFLKKIHSHSPCQFVEGPPARRQDPKSTLVALTAAPLILPFFQVQDKTSRDSLSFSQLARCVASWNRGGIFRRRPPAARRVKHPAGGACSTKTGRRAGRCKSLEVEQEQRELRLEPYPARSDALESSRRRRGALDPKKLVGKPLSLRARNKRALTRWRRPRSRD